MAPNAADIAQDILARARGKADAAEVIYQDSESRGISFSDNRLKSASSSAVRGVGLRVIHGGKVGFSSTNDFDAVDTLIANALDSAAFGQEAKFQFPASAAGGREVEVYDEAVVQSEMSREATKMREAMAVILREFPDAHCGGGASADYGRSVLCNSAGLLHEELSTNYEMGIGAFLVKGESFLWVDEGEESSKYSTDLLRHARKVMEWARWARKEVHVGNEQLPVLFTPSAVDILLATLDSNVNGKTVQKGASVLARRMGERILDERITIWDDPTVDYAPASMVADSEGVPARRKAIFEKGVLKTFLYDLQTAGMTGAQTTGNGLRGFSSLPSPSASNVRIEGGGTPLKEMLRSIKRGLLLEAALGAGQSNVLAGEFSVNVELGFLIENGEIVGRVKDCMLAGNAFDAFNRIRDLSAETEWNGELEAPHILFDSMSVMGAGK